MMPLFPVVIAALSALPAGAQEVQGREVVPTTSVIIAAPEMLNKDLSKSITLSSSHYDEEKAPQKYNVLVKEFKLSLKFKKIKSENVVIYGDNFGGSWECLAANDCEPSGADQEKVRLRPRHSGYEVRVDAQSVGNPIVEVLVLEDKLSFQDALAKRDQWLKVARNVAAGQEAMQAMLK